MSSEPLWHQCLLTSQVSLSISYSPLLPLFSLILLPHLQAQLSIMHLGRYFFIVPSFVVGMFFQDIYPSKMSRNERAV